MLFRHLSGYQFVQLDQLNLLQENFLSLGKQLDLKGTILLSHEGLNMNVSGEVNNIAALQSHLQQDVRFAEMHFNQTDVAHQSFKRFKVKIKKEIITFRQSHLNPTAKRAPFISPEQFKQWLDEKKDVLVLDTRNQYEVETGHFVNAMTLPIHHFCDLPNALPPIEKDQLIVMYCTGGIRCEKASLYFLDQGYQHVYQLDGGILNYFSKVGDAHYQGSCYVFDERAEVIASQ